MGWSTRRVRRGAVLALSLLLACGTVLGSTSRVAAGPSADEQARRWLETVSSNMSQPGRVFRADLTIRERGEAGEVTSNANLWIDSEQRKSRLEVRRDGALIGVTVIDNWDVAAYDAVNNKVNTVSVAEEARTNVRNPAFSVLAPSLLAAYQAGQINPDADVTTSTEQVRGREAARLTLSVRLSQDRPAASSSGQGQPQTQTINLVQEYGLWIDTASGLPLQESVRTTEESGREVATRTVTFENATLVERGSLPGNLLSIQAVQAMLASIEQQVERARNIGFPLFWLGMELPRAFTDAKGQRQPGLVLNDVQVLDLPNAPRQVILVYGTRDDPGTPYVVLRQVQRAQFEQMQREAGLPPLSQLPGVEQRPVQVPAGGEGVLYQIQPPTPPSSSGARGGTSGGNRPPSLPPLALVQITAGDGLTLIETPPIIQDGRQLNPFLDALQLAALAGALARMN